MNALDRKENHAHIPLFYDLRNTTSETQDAIPINRHTLLRGIIIHHANDRKSGGEFAPAQQPGGHGHQGAAGTGRQWLVDPLCGTLNYAAGTMLVAVNVALRDGAAAVADPFSGEIFFTDGGKAWMRHDGVDTPLAPTSATRLVDVNMDPPLSNSPGFSTLDLLANPGFSEHFGLRVVSTTLALTWVAAGKRAAYITNGGDVSASVHFAAGIAVCRAAGCVVTGLDGGPLGPERRGLVAAADAETHARLMSIIQEQAV